MAHKYGTAKQKKRVKKMMKAGKSHKTATKSMYKKRGRY